MASPKAMNVVRITPEVRVARSSSPRRPTSADVAREAGLSRATVGYVLNNVPHQTIPEPTRQRVLTAAAKLGYTPSAAARSLRSGRSDLVLCLMPDWPVGPSIVSLMAELSRRLEAHDLTLVAHQRGADGRPLAELWKAITPAAVLVLDQIPPADAQALAATGTTVTLAVRDGTNDPRMLSVTDERVGRMQAEHLAARGKRRLGYAYPTDIRLSTFAQPRLRGVEQTCAELGLEPPDVREIELERSSIAAAVTGWAGADPAVDGICAYNDEVAIALLAGLHERGQRIPADVAVVGVDDIPLARLSEPALTTVSTDVAALAGYLSDVVVADLRGLPPVGPHVGSDVLDVVVRDST